MVGNHKFHFLPAEQVYLGEAAEVSNIDTRALGLQSECVGSNPRPPIKR